MDYTTNSLRTILFPAFSKLQNDKEKFESAYFSVFNLSIFIGSLAAGILFFLSEEIILTLLGDKWQPSVLIFQILVFRLITSPFGALINKSLLGRGYSKEAFQFAQIRRVILLIPLYVGYLEGIYAFTIALVIANFVGFIISIFTTHKFLNISFKKQLSLFIVPLLPLLLLSPLYYYLLIDFNAYLLAFFFVIIQMSYSYLLKSPGLKVTIAQIKAILNRK